MEENELLKTWQDRLTINKAAYSLELLKMDKRAELYNGTSSIDGNTKDFKGKVRGASVVRNIVAELVEAQVDSSIPQPKVSARKEENEELATTIEDFLKNEIDRLPFEYLNDIDERVTPVQGGNYYLVEWDSNRHSVDTLGELNVTLLHPRQVILQAGVSDIDDMDFIIILISMSKKHVKEKYGVSVVEEKESNSEIRTDRANADDVVTVNIGYYRNKNGGIGRVTWCNDILLEHLEDYQARVNMTCKKCGAVLPFNAKKCSYCGSKNLEKNTEKEMTLFEDIEKSDGSIIPMYEENKELPFADMDEIMMNEYGESYEAIPKISYQPTKIPIYSPDCYPIVVRKNVSAFGRVLGDSDVDKISSQQNVIKKCDTRIQEKLDKGGSVLTKSSETKVDFTDQQLKIVNIRSPAELNMFSVQNLQVDIGMDRLVSEDSYSNAKNIIGITDSYMGRQDRTATSGTAKQIAVQQAAGRLESKKIMKNAAYSKLFEIMFKFLLAYADEPRTVRHSNINGSVEYSYFNKYDFLKQDETGAFYYDDDFLFSVDNSSSLNNNREALWQETRLNYESGTFGNPADIATQILFWTMMAKLQYPMAKDIRGQLEERQKQSEMMNNNNFEMPLGGDSYGLTGEEY